MFSIFSAKLSLIVVSGSVDSQTPSTFTFVFCQLKSFSGCSFSLLPAQEPIQRASVFLLFSLRPETFSKLSKILRASERDFSEPSRIKVVSSAYLLNLISVSLTNKPFISAFFRIALARISAGKNKKVRRERTALADTPVDRNFLQAAWFKICFLDFIMIKTYCGNDLAAFAKLSHVSYVVRTATDVNMSVVALNLERFLCRSHILALIFVDL